MQCADLNLWVVLSVFAFLLIVAYSAGRSKAFGDISVEWMRISKEWGALRDAGLKRAAADLAAHTARNEKTKSEP